MPGGPRGGRAPKVSPRVLQSLAMGSGALCFLLGQPQPLFGTPATLGVPGTSLWASEGPCQGLWGQATPSTESLKSTVKPGEAQRWRCPSPAGHVQASPLQAHWLDGACDLPGPLSTAPSGSRKPQVRLRGASQWLLTTFQQRLLLLGLSLALGGDRHGSRHQQAARVVVAPAEQWAVPCP